MHNLRSDRLTTGAKVCHLSTDSVIHSRDTLDLQF